MIQNGIVIGILIAVILIALYRAGKQITNPCAGCSGCTPLKMEEKQLVGPIVMRRKIRVRGMKCAHCCQIAEASINQISGLSAKADGRKGEIIISGIRAFSNDEIDQALRIHEFEIVNDSSEHNLKKTAGS